MLQVYSIAQTLTNNTYVNFINKTVEKGCTSIQLTPNTVQLNKSGVYMIYCNANVTAAAAGDAQIQLYRNGVVVPEAKSISTAAADSTVPLYFTTLVRVQNVCCKEPVVIQVMYTGPEATGDTNLCVTKLC